MADALKAMPSKKKEKAPKRDFMKEAQEAVGVARYVTPEIAQLQEQYGPRLAKGEVATATARGEAELAGVKAQGPAIREALLASSPELAESSAALRRTVGELGPSPIETQLRQQATTELGLGRQLAPGQIRDVNQASRAAFSARGIMGGMPSAVTEVMNRDAAAEARLAGRRQFAAGVDTMGMQRRASDAAIAQNAFAAQGAYFDPYQRLYGKGGSVVSGTVSAPGQFQPYIAGAQDVGKSNIEATMDQRRIEEAAREFDVGLEATRQSALLSRGDTMAAQDANNRAATSAGYMKAGGIAAGIILAALI